MNKHSRIRINKIVNFIVVLLVVTLVLAVGIIVQKRLVDNATEQCDNMFGKGNYHWIEYRANMVKCGLSECWKCEGLENGSNRTD